MAKPSLDDLIDSVRKGPAPDPKKVAAEKRRKARERASEERTRCSEKVKGTKR